MKRFVLLFTIVLNVMLGGTCFASTAKLTKDFDSVTNYENITKKDILNVAKNYIPGKYIPAFEYFTECETEEETMDLMIQILAIGQWESGWKVTKSPKNKNGSYDIGYLALNSNNISNDWFMDRFGVPTECEFTFTDEDDELELYLIVCINFYKYLFDMYGSDATLCYNCGERRYLKGTIPNTTWAYSRRINELVGKFVYESDKEAADRIEYEQKCKELVESLRSKFEEIFVNHIKSFKKKPMPNTNTCSPIYPITVIQFEFKTTILYVVIRGQQYILIKEDLRERIDALLKSSCKPNPHIVCVGYVRKYGNRVAPVFQNTLTGERFIC